MLPNIANVNKKDSRRNRDGSREKKTTVKNNLTYFVHFHLCPKRI